MAGPKASSRWAGGHCKERLPGTRASFSSRAHVPNGTFQPAGGLHSAVLLS